MYGILLASGVFLVNFSDNRKLISEECRYQLVTNMYHSSVWSVLHDITKIINITSLDGFVHQVVSC